jgi:uncharacterized protein (DUF1015 family)
MIKPFKGILYHNSQDLSSVIAPPYDVIKPGEQELYYQKSLYNIIRLEYGLAALNDRTGDNRYTRAAAAFQQWLAEGVLYRETKEMFYIYEQAFTVQNNRYHRTGLAVALKAESYRQKSVLPHEETLQKPKSDRLELLRHCRANFSPIFGLYSDPDNNIGSLISEAKLRQPLFQFSESDGAGHTLWVLPDPDKQNTLINLFAAQPVFIADGHHRYETAVAFAEESDLNSHPGCNYLLAILVSLQDPGLIILPTHRMLTGLPVEKLAALIEIAHDHFTVFKRGKLKDLDLNVFLDEIRTKGISGPALGLLISDQALLLQARSGAETLDVSILQKLILNPLFADLGSYASEEYLSYIKDETEALEAVRCRKAQAAFLLNPTPIAELTAHASRGEKMPQKSTYFYPKLPSGLIIHHLDLSH